MVLRKVNPNLTQRRVYPRICARTHTRAPTTATTLQLRADAPESKFPLQKAAHNVYEKTIGDSRQYRAHGRSSSRSIRTRICQRKCIRCGELEPHSHVRAQWRNP